MITIEQEKQIIDYLTDKKLPLDLLLELQDHMLLQISEYQNKEDLNFDEAFLKVQKCWQKEMQMTTYLGYSLNSIPIIAKKMMSGKFNAILKNAFLLVLVSFIFNIFLVYISGNKENYEIVYQLYNSLFLIVPFMMYVLNYRIMKYTSSNKKYKGKLFYTIFQSNAGPLAVSIIFMSNVWINNPDKIPGWIFEFFTTHKLSVSIIIANTSPFFMQFLIIFGILNFIEHKKSLERIKNFLSVSG